MLTNIFCIFVNTMKSKTLQKLQQVYDVKDWGATVEELEQLEKYGHIIRRRGVNSTLIELLTLQ